MASCPCHQRTLPGTYWLQIWVVWHVYAHTECTHVHAYTHTAGFIFPQLCWTTSPSTIWRGNTVTYKPFRNTTGFMPNWIISFYTLCQFLEINNRPFHVGLWSHQLSHGVFADVFRLGLLLQNSTGQVKPSQVGLSQGLRYVLCTRWPGHVLAT